MGGPQSTGQGACGTGITTDRPLSPHDTSAVVSFACRARVAV
jgi:hypothetical protein